MKNRENSRKQQWRQVLEQEESQANKQLPPVDDEMGDDALDPAVSRFSSLGRIWTWLALLLFVGTLSAITFVCCLAWCPDENWVITPNGDSTELLDVPKRIALSGTGEIVFTEEEMNRLIAQQCRLSHQGAFSIFSRPESLQLRVCDGYVQMGVIRLLGSNKKHTMITNVQFERVYEDEHYRVRCRLSGGEAILNRFPRGGQVGLLPIPELLMEVMIPSLNRFSAFFPELRELVEQRGYLPCFAWDHMGRALIKFVPPPPTEITDVN